MGTTSARHSDVQAEKSDESAEELLGRLQLATGEVVAVPAEGYAIATEHYSEKEQATVPVVGRYLISRDA